jgi:hypothetical protein
MDTVEKAEAKIKGKTEIVFLRNSARYSLKEQLEKPLIQSN